MTLPTQLVLHVLLEDPERELYGLEICAAAELASGTIHPILARLEKVGWVLSRWEQVDPSKEGRPRRRYYRLDPNSVGMVKAALQRSSASARSWGRLRPGVGEVC
jgi:DNA-binding PadR family transcriptional regulator